MNKRGYLLFSTVCMLFVTAPVLSAGDSVTNLTLFKAIDSQPDDAIKKMIAENPLEIHTKNSDGKTVLHHAAEKRRSKIVACLLEAHVLPNTYNNEGLTPLIIAVRNGDISTVQELLKGHADPNISKQNDLSATPLAYAHALSENIKQNMINLLSNTNTQHANNTQPTQKLYYPRRVRKFKKIPQPPIVRSRL